MLLHRWQLRLGSNRSQTSTSNGSVVSAGLLGTPPTMLNLGAMAASAPPAMPGTPLSTAGATAGYGTTTASASAAAAAAAAAAHQQVSVMQAATTTYTSSSSTTSSHHHHHGGAAADGLSSAFGKAAAALESAAAAAEQAGGGSFVAWTGRHTAGGAGVCREPFVQACACVFVGWVGRVCPGYQSSAHCAHAHARIPSP